MKHIKTFETFSNEDIIDEGWKDIASTITKPFRKRTDEEIEMDASKIINDKLKLNKIEDILKNCKNPRHYKNYTDAKDKFDKGDKMPFYKFILFVKDNINQFKDNNPMYYSINQENGDIEDTRQMSYQSGPGGRNWSE